MKTFAYARLAEELVGEIANGTHRTGEKLPSVRTLAAQTGLSMTTVIKALEEVERRGLVEARPRSGYFVLAQNRMEAPRVSRRAPRPRAATLHALTESVVGATGRAHLTPLGGAALGPTLIPIKALARETREILRRDPEAFARYSETAGLLPLRREIAKRQRASPDELVITSGCMDAMRLSLMATARPNDLIALESPTFFGMLQLVRDLGMRAIEIPVDPTRGIDLEILGSAMKKHPIRAAIVTPNFQNPMGVTMSDADKETLVDLARRHRVSVIESDVYGDLPHAGARPRPLAAFDDGETVLSCSSFSKTLAPGLRIGWVRPGRHLERVKSLKLSGTICSPQLDQRVLQSFLASGAYARHLKRLRPALASQVAAVRSAVERAFPAGTRLSRPTGGFLLWVQLPSRVDAVRLHQEALNQKIAILPGAVCSLTPTFSACIRLSCGHPWTENHAKAIRRLARMVERQLAQAA